MYVLKNLTMSKICFFIIMFIYESMTVKYLFSFIFETYSKPIARNLLAYVYFCKVKHLIYKYA